MNEYTFERNPEDREIVRLRMVEKAVDHDTIELLQSTGIGQGWQCLELGPGAGSIMRWMGSIVGESGSVVGVDRNTNHVRDLSDPPFHLIEGEFLEASLDGRFNLAHCRYVLIHNRHSEQLLRKLCSVLKPDGILVIEEPDFTSAKLLNRDDDVSHLRVNNAICRMFEDRQLDPAYGLSLPGKMASKGLQILDVDSRIHLARGGSPMAQLMAESASALGDKYVATGEATETDIHSYVKNAEDDQVWSVYYSTVSVTAKR